MNEWRGSCRGRPFRIDPLRFDVSSVDVVDIIIINTHAFMLGYYQCRRLIKITIPSQLQTIIPVEVFKGYVYMHVCVTLVLNGILAILLHPILKLTGKLIQRVLLLLSSIKYL